MPYNGLRLSCRPPCTDHTPTAARCEAAIVGATRRLAAAKAATLHKPRPVSCSRLLGSASDL
jgi:hypothetical protein